MVFAVEPVELVETEDHLGESRQEAVQLGLVLDQFLDTGEVAQCPGHLAGDPCE